MSKPPRFLLVVAPAPVVEAAADAALLFRSILDTRH